MAVKDFFRRIASKMKDPTKGPVPSYLESDLNRIRKQNQGKLRSPRPSGFDYLLIDVMEAGELADRGQLGELAKHWRGCYRNATFQGLLSTRSAGLVSLPKIFKGSPDAVDWLQRGYGTSDDPQSAFDFICPPQELSAMVEDGVGMGVAVAQLVEIEGLDHPVLARLDPAGLEYRINENLWVYNTDFGPVAIQPGDGQWVLYTPGGRVSPWQRGVGLSTAKATTRIESALLSLDSFLYRYGLPGRHATYPEGASQDDREALQELLEDWSNTAFTTPEGYKVDIMQLSAEGAKIFPEIVASLNDEIIMAIAGQKVSVDGGAGFSNTEIHRNIRQDLIKNDAAALADCLNTQVLPQALAAKFGTDTYGEIEAYVSWNVEPPKDVMARAQGLQASAQAFTQLTGKALGDTDGVNIDVKRLAEELQIPLVEAPAGKPQLKVVK